MSPLHSAAKNGHADVVEFLLEEGADLSLRTKVRACMQLSQQHADPPSLHRHRPRLCLQDGKLASDLAGNMSVRQQFADAEDEEEDEEEEEDSSSSDDEAAAAAQAPACAPSSAMAKLEVQQPPQEGGVLRPSGAKVALCIGVSAYETAGELHNTLHDAIDVGAALKSVGFTVTTLQNATFEEMSKALDAFGDALEAGGVAFFFFSGHGSQGRDGKNYLIPKDWNGRANDLPLRAICLEQVASKLEDSKCMLHCVVSDACRSSMKRGMSETRGGNADGFRALDAPPAEAGSIVAYSYQPGSVSWDAPAGGGRNGAYTTALLHHLTVPGLHVETIFTRTART